MNFELPPKVDAALLPTRLERLDRYSDRVGRNVWIKRDDLTEAAAGGNKIRKLEYLIGDAQEQKADVLVTCGGIQSNHARTTAIVGRRLGLDSVLALRGTPQDTLEGNYLLDRLAGAEVVFVSPEEYERRDAVMADLAEELRTEGRNPYVIPEGGSNALGAMGYVDMIRELKEQMDDREVSFESIVCCLGSGGTYAGILMGIALHGISAKAFGVLNQRDAGYFQDHLERMMNDAVRNLGFPHAIPPESIRMIDGYIGPGYGQNTPEEIALMSETAREEGIILDPVYTGKTFFALDDMLRRDPSADGALGRNILFVHTGGIFGLFPKQAVFEEALTEGPRQAAGRRSPAE